MQMAQISSKKCDLCDKRTGIFFCYECQQALCEVCHERHNKIPATCGHKITDIQKIDLSSFKTKSRCEEHKRELAIYCEKCKILICSKCVTSVHKGHSFSDIEEIASEERIFATKTVTEIKQKITVIEEMKERVKSKHLITLRTDVSRIKSEIKDSCKDLQDFVIAKRDIKVTEIEDFEKLEKQQLESFLRNVEPILSKHKSLCSEIENLLSESHDVTFHLCLKTLRLDLQNQEGIPEEPMIVQVPSSDLETFYKEVLHFMNSKFSKSICDSCEERKKEMEKLEVQEKETQQELKSISDQFKKQKKEIETFNVKEKETQQELKRSQFEKERQNEENKKLKEEIETLKERLRYSDVMESKVEPVEVYKKESIEGHATESIEGYATGSNEILWEGEPIEGYEKKPVEGYIGETMEVYKREPVEVCELSKPSKDTKKYEHLFSRTRQKNCNHNFLLCSTKAKARRVCFNCGALA